jgi:hypothetical protein
MSFEEEGMRRTTLLIAGIVLLAAAAFMVFIHRTTPTVAAAPATSSSLSESDSNQWEYLVVTSPSNVNFGQSSSPSMRKDRSGAFAREGFVLEQNMDKLGAKGWQLVSVTGGPEPVYYFKRPKQGGDSSGQ